MSNNIEGSEDIDFNNFSEGTESNTTLDGEDGSKSDDYKKLEQEVTELKDKYLRSAAEFENYKKRAQRERSDLLKYQGEQLIIDFLPIIDNMELALQHAESDPDTLKEGVKLIYKMLVDVLAKWEVVGDAAVGTKFDPSRHNAISKVPTADIVAIVINEVKKLYTYKDKMIRPAEVVVSVAMDPS